MMNIIKLLTNRGAELNFVYGVEPGQLVFRYVDVIHPSVTISLRSLVMPFLDTDQPRVIYTPIVLSAGCSPKNLMQNIDWVWITAADINPDCTPIICVLKGSFTFDAGLHSVF